MFKRAVSITYQFQYELKIDSQEAINHSLIKRPSNVFEILAYRLSENEDVKNVSTEKLKERRVSRYFFKKQNASKQK